MLSRLFRRFRDERGFTLVELLVVVAIIGVLAVTLVPRVINRTDTAKENVAQSNLQAIKSVIDIYYTDTGRLPDSNDIDDVLKEGGISWTGQPGGIVDPWGKAYGYKKVDSTHYQVVCKGKNSQNNNSENIQVSDSLSPTKGAIDFSPDATSDGSAW